MAKKTITLYRHEYTIKRKLPKKPLPKKKQKPRKWNPYGDGVSGVADW